MVIIMMTQASYYFRVTHATPEIDGSHLAEVQYVDYPPKSRDIDPQVTKSVVHGSDPLLVGNQTTRTRIGPPPGLPWLFISPDPCR